MIRFTDNLWVGGSNDIKNIRAISTDAILNVAHDLMCTVGWPDIEYAQVGLIDGPGNPLAAYHAAVLALVALLKRHRVVLVYCHEGRSRSVAVAIMYLNLMFGGGWDGVRMLLDEQGIVDLPTPHEAHRTAFDKMNWKTLLDTL